MRALLVALLLAGCTAAELDHFNPPIAEPPCDAQNPYRCTTGPVCCTSTAPVCKGPDATGYYCEPSQADPSDPANFAARKRVRAIPRTDPAQ